MPALTEIFGDDSVLQFGGGTLGSEVVISRRDTEQLENLLSGLLP
jgi:hypothetical protein